MMNYEAMFDIKLERLKEQIDELREILNEICVSPQNTELTKEMLIVSQCLDELIVEYMNQINEAKNAI